MNPRSASKAVAGFTLLEIVISTGILSIVLVIVYGVFARTLSQKEHTEAISLETSTARAVIRQIIRDLEAVEAAPSAAPRRTPTPSRSKVIKASEQFLFLSRNRTEHGVPFDDLAFSTSLRKPTGGNIAASDLAAIRYFAEPAATDTGNMTLWRETVFSLSGNILDPDNPEPERTIRIVSGLAGLEFRFFDGSKWVEEWDSSNSRNFAPVPHAVEIALAIRSQDGVVNTYRTAIDLPIAKETVPLRGGSAGANTTPSPQIDNTRRGRR